jgi:hypothetical protein
MIRTRLGLRRDRDRHAACRRPPLSGSFGTMPSGSLGRLKRGGQRRKPLSHLDILDRGRGRSGSFGTMFSGSFGSCRFGSLGPLAASGNSRQPVGTPAGLAGGGDRTARAGAVETRARRAGGAGTKHSGSKA